MEKTGIRTRHTKNSERRQDGDRPSIIHQHEPHAVDAPCRIPARRILRVEIKRRRGSVSTMHTKHCEPRQIEDELSTIEQRESHAIAAPCVTPSRRSRRVEIRREVSKYQFSEEDDVYISTKVMEGCSWAKIRNDRKKWRKWPLYSLEQHWNELKQRNSHLQVDLQGPILDKSQEPPSLLHHLPTPTSSRHGDHLEESIETCTPRESNQISSSNAYDNEELELLSIAGDSHPDMPAMCDDGELLPDVVLPSIETPLEPTEEDEIQQDLQKSPTIEPPRIMENQNIASARKEMDQRHSSNPQQSTPDPTSNPRYTHSHANTTNSTPSQPVNTFQRQTTRRRSTSINLVGDDDELLAPATPHIKRESSTPLPLSFLYSSPAPNTRPAINSSISASTSKIIDQKAFRKQIKQSWTKMGTPRRKSGGKVLAKRKSYPVLARKRAWDDGEEGSEDELAM